MINDRKKSEIELCSPMYLPDKYILERIYVRDLIGDRIYVSSSDKLDAQQTYFPFFTGTQPDYISEPLLNLVIAMCANVTCNSSVCSYHHPSSKKEHGLFFPNIQRIQ